MVIGNGMLAKAFVRFQNNDDVVIFASGVSNSNETARAPFERELAMLNQQLSRTAAKLVYFSTVSVYDPTLQQSAYIRHKKYVEQHIATNASSWLIFRLPIVVGSSTNPFTLTNYLFEKIKRGEHFQLYNQACRYLIDVEDVSNLLSPLIDSVSQQTFNIHLNNRIDVKEMVSLFEQIIGITAHFTEVNKGSCYDVDNAEFRKVISTSVHAVDYNRSVLRKYYAQ